MAWPIGQAWETMMARWHRAHGDFVDCEVLEVVQRGKTPRHGKLLILVGRKKHTVYAHQVYDWEEPKIEESPRPDENPEGDQG